MIRILGYNQNEVVGQNIHELIHCLHADGTPYPEVECRIDAAHKCNENIHHADVKTATQFTHHRDPETGMHLERMARYSRLIAIALGAGHLIDDEFVDRTLRHAPLHDVGKITIPDRILLKPGPLTGEEFAEMKTHTTRGREIIDTMLLNFNIKSRILR